MLSECDRPPYPRARLMRATVITDNGERIKLSAVAPSRASLDDLLDRTYPGARMVSIIVVREATC